jgi:CDP-diacylglycerol--glycerol-3-phosphate 3-phosphatidyltransferase
VLLAADQFRWAALAIFLAGLVDITDGQVARRQGRATTFGAFYDSMIGRYSDMVLYMGLIIHFALIGRFFYVVLTAVAMMSSFMVSYSQARAESLIPSCKVGFMERPERMALLILGGVLDRMAPVLWVIAVFSTWTVIHRIIYTWKETAAGRSLAEERE